MDPAGFDQSSVLVSSSILAGLLGAGFFAAQQLARGTYSDPRPTIMPLYAFGLLSVIFPFAIIMAVIAWLYHAYLHFALLSGMLACVGLYLRLLYKMRYDEYSYGAWSDNTTR